MYSSLLDCTVEYTIVCENLVIKLILIVSILYRRCERCGHWLGLMNLLHKFQTVQDNQTIERYEFLSLLIVYVHNWFMVLMIFTQQFGGTHAPRK